LLKVCSIGSHGVVIHWIATLAHTGAYSIVQTVGSSFGHAANSQFGHDLPTALPSGQSLASMVHAVCPSPGFVSVQHSPLIYDRSSQIVQSFNVHIQTCPHVVSTTSKSHPLSRQYIEAGLASVVSVISP